MTDCQYFSQDLHKLLLKLYRFSHEMTVVDFQDAALALVKTVLPLDSMAWHDTSFLPSGTESQKLPFSAKDHLQPRKKLPALLAELLDLPLIATGSNNACQPCHPGKGFTGMTNEPRIGFMQWIALFLVDPDPCDESGEARLLAQLAPHIVQALVLNYMTHFAQDESTHKGKNNLAITDLNGKLYYASPAFEAMLRAEWSDWFGAELPGALLTHFSLTDEHFKGHSLVVSHRSEYGFSLLSARPLCLADRLTPREHTIAKLLATGATHKKIALLLERSPATVRNHIQSIYNKLEIGNIASLIEALHQVNELHPPAPATVASITLAAKTKDAALRHRHQIC